MRRAARSRWGGAVAAALAVAIGVRAAAAHDQPYSYVDLQLAGRSLEGRVMAHVVDLARAAGVAEGDSLRGASGVRRYAGALEAALERRLFVTADGRRIQPEWTGCRPVPGRSLVAFEWRVLLPESPGSLRVLGPLFAEDPQHETFVNFYRRDSARGVLRLAAEELLDHSRTTAELRLDTRREWLALVLRFVFEGTRHIFIGPDHVLFIVGLLLLGGGLARLLKIATAFTLAHSATLALATLQLVNPPPRIIEPAIALSIVLVGIENLAATRRPRDLRVALAFLFGLVHGFGFASVLRDLGLPRGSLAASLVSFNAGVELGQAAIVCGAAPLLALLRARDPALAGRVAFAGSTAVIAAGGYWLVQRVVFPA